MTAALEAHGLSFTHPGGERPALDGVSIRVDEGSFTGLLGPNGAGKTTFVSLVCGLLSPGDGGLRIFGSECGSRAAQRALGYCPQELALYPTLSAAENLRLFGRLAGLSGRHLAERVEACLDIASLGQEGGARVERFSGGMKRRLNLSVALLHEPRLLLLDEPTVGVDAQSRLAIFDALEALSATGTTIVYTTHYMEEVERLCREVVVIDRGRVLAARPTQEFAENGRRTHTFRLALGEELDAAVVGAEIARSDVGIRHRAIEDGLLEITGEDLAALTAIVSRLSERGVVETCETFRPTLEERFLELTGEELRD